MIDLALRQRMNGLVSIEGIKKLGETLEILIDSLAEEDFEDDEIANYIIYQVQDMLKYEE